MTLALSFHGGLCKKETSFFVSDAPCYFINRSLIFFFFLIEQFCELLGYGTRESEVEVPK